MFIIYICVYICKKIYIHIYIYIYYIHLFRRKEDINLDLTVHP